MAAALFGSANAETLSFSENLMAEQGRRDRDIERTYSRPQFVDKLRRLADALETGAPFTIQVAGEQLRVPADVAFNIEHERDGGMDELEFQLRWRADR